MDNYKYWEITFISCESNERWTIARTPRHWTEEDIREAINRYGSGSGDDPAEIISIIETTNTDYSWDYE